MKTLLFFTICLIKGHMGDVTDTMTGITGGSVIIIFVYGPGNVKTRDSAKSFCKVSSSKCTIMTEEKHDLWIPDERFSLTDDKSLGFISVLVRDLSVNDSGTYRCKADSTWTQELNLDVKQESCCGTSEEQTAYFGGTAVIRCKYPEKYKDHLKQLYKVQNGSLQSYFTRETNPRFSLDESEQEHVFTVNIANVSRHDDGVYFCGAHVQNNPRKIRYSPLFTEIQLHVTGFPDLHIIIIVCVCLTLLLAGGLSLLLLKRKCKKTQATGSGSSDQRSTGDADEVASAAYAMITDSGDTTLRSSAQKPVCLKTVYDTAHLPTNPSDSGFYTLAEQPQNMTCM